MKLCKDCKWLTSDSCFSTKIVDPVTGRGGIPGVAQSIRLAEGMCGMKAKWFEPLPVSVVEQQDAAQEAPAR